jgi:acyl carrier protein
MEKFRELVADLLEYDEVNELNMNTPMKDLDDWDSLTLLGFLAMIENEYNIQISVPNLNVDLSFEDFYNQFLVD